MTANAKKLVTILSVGSAVAGVVVAGMRLYSQMKSLRKQESDYDEAVASTMDASDPVAKF